VLILKHRERTVVPGGGGTRVMNLAALGVKVFPSVLSAMTKRRDCAG